MFAVRYLALAALVVWLGGMIVLALLVAPSTFRVIQETDPAAGRVLAGHVFGEILRQFHLLAYGGGTLLLLCLFIMKFVGPPPRGFVIRTGIVSGMLAVALYSGVAVARELAQIQSQITGPVVSLPEHDTRRARFDRLHRTSNVLMAVNMCLGLVLLFWYVRE